MKTRKRTKHIILNTALIVITISVSTMCAILIFGLVVAGDRYSDFVETAHIEKRVTPESHTPPPEPLSVSRCMLPGLSRQFDVDLETVQYEDSVFVTVSLHGKSMQQRTDHTIVFNPLDPDARLGVWWYTDPEYGCSDVTSYSTGHNADREKHDNYWGTIVVADLNFDGRDDIAMASDSAVSSGPYYTFLTQTADGKFVTDRFLTEEMRYFPDEIDRSRRRLTTYSPASSVDKLKQVFELDPATDEWKMIVHDLLP